MIMNRRQTPTNAQLGKQQTPQPASLHLHTYNSQPTTVPVATIKWERRAFIFSSSLQATGKAEKGGEEGG